MQSDCLECAHVNVPSPYFSISPSINYAADSDHLMKLFPFLCRSTDFDFRIIIGFIFELYLPVVGMNLK